MERYSVNVRRAKIIKDTSLGDGIFSIDGEQTVFSLQKHWKSDQAPKIEMIVEATFDSNNTLVSVIAIPQNEIVKEQLAKAAESTQKVAADVLGKAAETGVPLLKGFVARIGILPLLLISSILFSWIFLNLIEVRLFANSTQGISFYDLMRIANNADNINIDAVGSLRGGAGFYGFICFLILTLPIIPHYTSGRKNWLFYIAPGLLMVITISVFYFKIKSAFSSNAEAMKALGGSRMSDIASQMVSEMLKAVSMGMGFYLSIIACGLLAALGIRKFLLSSTR